MASRGVTHHPADLVVLDSALANSIAWKDFQQVIDSQTLRPRDFIQFNSQFDYRESGQQQRLSIAEIVATQNALPPM